ncbi:High affinity cAMP-specific 3',5'-cyclic phosphodiesterase 7A [Merluccius polli]|uniref:Phosphodiesterase n=1 Tax=Merluccius polli TaxID=89951 RepID=A0AA47N3J3_MERPO|nr:High affinity cAMP-specific 3',5'-cyclic phosphodiesterase 7A [Merluccius polli]
MEVCPQLPVLPLDRPVPQHVLRRRGAISLGPGAWGSALFGGPSPRQLCKRRGGVSYTSADQAVLYLHLLGDVRQRGPGPSEPEQRAPHSHVQVDYQSLHCLQGPVRPGARGQRSRCRRLSFQRFLKNPHLLRQQPPGPLHLVDQEYTGQVKCMLNKVDSWDFDIFLFDRFTNGNSLVTLTFHLFLQLGLTRLFRLDPIKLHRFLVMVQADYHQLNPYHNYLHAADVTQAMYCYLREPQLAETLSSCDMLLALVAAVTHDLDHPGVNQGFLVRTGHHLAALYKNSSVLESHHWRCAVSLLRESALLDHLPPIDRLNLEERLGSLILATDISQQNRYLARFREHLDRGDLSMAEPSHRHLVLQMTMKCADICNPCRVWRLSSQWSSRVTTEFFHQGDVEKKHGMAVSPLCDRLSDSTAHIQAGFIRHVVEPLFREWRRFSCTSLSHRMLAHLQTNLDRWMARSQRPETTS